jgi:uncharacterized protein with HEPN domain
MSKLNHDYMSVDYSIVWDVVKKFMPVLKNQIELILIFDELS